LLGIPCDISRLSKIARERNVYLIDDTAQAMGAKLNGQMLGTYGDIGFFSLGRGKNMTTIEGGIILSNSDELATLLQKKIAVLPKLAKVNRLTNFVKLAFLAIFLPPQRYWFVAKLPFLKLGKSEFSTRFKITRYSRFAAGLGLSLLPELSHNNEVRAMNTTMLNETIKNLHNQLLRAIDIAATTEPAYSRFPLLFSDRELRDKVYHQMPQFGIGASRMYPSSIDKIPHISRYLARRQDHFPISHLVAETILTLPTHPYVTKKDLTKMQQILSQIKMKSMVVKQG
jgi:perosamine synthetase